MNDSPARRAVIQFLATEVLLGVDTVPVSMPRGRVGSRESPAFEANRPANSKSGDSGPSQSPGPTEGRQDSTATRAHRLQVLNDSQVRGCRKCGLSETRTQTVFGQGCVEPRLVFVGEAPGYEEDQQGLAFVGRAGQLLTRMIAAMGVSRDEVFICNVLKCRPPNNREPASDEILACRPYLLEQLSILNPEVLVALGAPAAKTLLNTAESIGRLRGRFHDYFLSGVTGQGPSIPLMPTYHPAYLLRSPAEKRKSWEDLLQVMNRLGLEPPATARTSS